MPKAATRKYGISAIELVRLIISENASIDQYLLITNSCTTVLVSQIAATGNLRSFCFANIFGIVPMRAAANSTSAQMSDHARYAPRIETISPAPINTVPNG